MSDKIILPVQYKIESIRWQGQFVSVGGQDGTTIVGNQKIIGGTQTWKVKHDPSTGMVTFQGVQGSYPGEEGKYIALGEEGMLVYSDEASWFRLVKLPTVTDAFMVEDSKYSIDFFNGWHLHNDQDGCPVTLNNILLPGGEWKLIPVF
ncbi:uncharacterized protein EDB91DRAFT_1333016 [Suillus paluster]|uniref:uncharacterized protein n=1 Tax=Suillus paluster TaxID=48578 RepID=UPI001B878437|nr:uncharacterized protein EDB91DRAFT_1333016 [Suillus paluster]KAG1753567.1 hypothetical protein EDB91DRAFT_1333016 [Suillus paluster]